MRNLKFKVWDAGRKEWLHKMPFALYGETTLMGYIDRRPDDSSVKCAELKDLVPLQYIGLKDRYGIEIYEGDIVAMESVGGQQLLIGSIQFDEQSAGFVLRYKHGVDERNATFGGMFPMSNFVVKGNIYEHPTLLSIDAQA